MEIDASVLRTMKETLGNCKPMYPEKFYGEIFTPHGVVTVSGKDGVSGNPEAVAWFKEWLRMTPELQAEIAKTLGFDHGGSQSPSEESKRVTILGYAKKYDCEIFVETGTNKGDTVQAIHNYFDDVYSIELGPSLYRDAQQRFADFADVHLICGDAGDVLWDLIPTLPSIPRVLFYLDAHSRYDETSPEGKGIGTSVPREIKAIFSERPNSVVLIDDARLFTHQFNKTWPQLEETILELESFGVWNVDLKDDMIRLVPKTWASIK